ncbi:MAG TPA: alpha/beta hydrolase [Anaerolineae bacterium]|nr:alpha/beta hydrolase [Anaerolineae bacterium]
MTTWLYQKQQITPNLTLAYHQRGLGHPLILLHGFTGTAQRHFPHLLPRLATTYHVIAPDLRGYGHSQPPTRTFPPNFYHRDADDIAALITALNLPPAIILGFSDGAESALLLAARHPHLVTAVIAWGVSGVISTPMVDSVAEWLPADNWPLNHPEWLSWRQQIITDHGPHQFPALIDGWVAAARAIHAAGGNICLHEAPQIQCPTLLLNGSLEHGNTPADLHALAQAIPRSQLHFIPNAPHAIHHAQPDLFYQTVTSFLQNIHN